MDASPLLWVVPFSGLVAVVVAAYFAYDVLNSPTGTPQMQEVAGAIYEAAVAFIQRQYRTIFLLAIGGMVLIAVVSQSRSLLFCFSEASAFGADFDAFWGGMPLTI